QLEVENPGNVIGWFADHNLQVRASQSLTANGSTLIRVRNDVTSPWRDWLTIDPTEIGNIQGFSADNKSLYFMTSLDANTARLLKMDIETGERTLIAEDAQYDLSDIILHPTTYALEAIGVERERYEWITLDPQ